jgi:hypothetical protein
MLQTVTFEPTKAENVAELWANFLTLILINSGTLARHWHLHCVLSLSRSLSVIILTLLVVYIINLLFSAPVFLPFIVEVKKDFVMVSPNVTCKNPV